MSCLDQFEQVWLIDFEYRQPDGETPTVHCMVAREYRTGETLRLWADGLAADRPPFPVDETTLIVAYYASAEVSCFLELGWPVPLRVLDLYAEFRCKTNGLSTPNGAGLLGALTYHGLDAMAATEKEEMRELAIRGGEYTEAERVALLDYCESDVVALDRLLTVMLPMLAIGPALLRGRYMAAAAAIERNGVPMDCETLYHLRDSWESIKSRLIREIDKDYGVFVPTGKKINTNSQFGLAVLDTAERFGVDKHLLADASRDLWKRKRIGVRERIDAITAARKATGLTVNRIEKWESSGKDHSTYPGLDVTARELANEYPELGIGSGYSQDDVYFHDDPAARLWEQLREPTPKSLPRHDQGVIEQAAEMVADCDQLEGVPLSFSAEQFSRWLREQNIAWPRLASGTLDLSDDTFRQQARRYPSVAPIRELRFSLSQLRLNSLAVGTDGRNRCGLSAFRARTGRNQPSNAKFCFGPSAWIRSLIQPPPGRAVAYIDWEQQEFGIAAALSGDAAMSEAYSSGDPYLTFAKQAGAVPRDATKRSHPTERDQFKVTTLAVQYGMGEESLATALGDTTAKARQLLGLHKQTYPKFWRWSQAAVDHAMLKGRLWTVFDWRIHVGENSNPRSLANFPMQANGAEMLRLACCLLIERGVKVCAPVHDAVLIEADATEIGAEIARTQATMLEASRIVLNGFELRTDAEVVTYPNRYMDKRGKAMWETVTRLLEETPAPEVEAF